ncbi:hypothetical protein BVRB_5g110980 [Beta vulgaris subsp. vulgaris]|nr:hypothetical protein BVRB_5g110980 [Beta vulgaris subsp. vulgaris]
MTENTTNLASLAKQIADLMEMNAMVHADMAEMRRDMVDLRSNRRDVSPPSVGYRRREDELKLSDLPSFDGDEDAEAYLDWERRLERLFNHKQLDEHSRFSYATLKLARYASLWFDSLQARRESEGTT